METSSCLVQCAIVCIVITVFWSCSTADSRVVQFGLHINENSAENEAVRLAISKLNSSSDNISFVVKLFNTSEERQLYDQATSLLQLDIVTLLEGNKLRDDNACVLAETTGIPMIRIHSDSNSAGQCESMLHLSPDYRAYMRASLDVINTLGWKNIILVFDEDRFYESLYFTSISKKWKLNITPFQLFRQDSKIDQSMTVKQIIKLRGMEADVFLLNCDPKIIGQILQEKSSQPKRNYRWILQREVPRNLSGQSNNVVVAFKLPFWNSSTSRDLEAVLLDKYPHYKKDTMALVYDAVQIIKQAVNIAPCSTLNGSDIQSDRDNILSCMKKVRLDGISGPIRFDGYGRRTDVHLDILNLHNNSLMKIYVPSAKREGHKSEKKKRGSVTYSTDQENEIGTWNVSHHAMLFKNISRNTEPSTILKGERLRVVTIEDAPFVMITKGDDGKLIYEGYCIDMLNELARTLNFTYDIFPSPDGAYGALRTDGSWNGMMGEVLNGRADLIIAAIAITEERRKVADFTVPYFFYTDDILLKRPSLEAVQIWQFMAPFDDEVWFATLATVAVISVCTFVLNYFSPYGYKNGSGLGTSEEFNFFNSVWFTLACMLQQGGDNTPRSLSGRILAGVYWFCVLIWVSTYTATLANFFTVKNAASSINSLDDIVRSSYEVGILHGGSTYDSLRLSKLDLHAKLLSRMERQKSAFVDNSSHGIHLVRNKEKYGFIYDGPILKFAANKQPCDLMTVPAVDSAKGLAISLPANNPSTDDFTLAVLKLHENDFLQELKRKWWGNMQECTQEGLDGGLSERRISLMSMLGVYIVLMVGLFSAFLVMMAERTWKEKRETNRGLTIPSIKTEIKPKDENNHDHDDHGKTLPEIMP